MRLRLWRNVPTADEAASVTQPDLPDESLQQRRLLEMAGIEAKVIFDGGAYIGDLTARYLTAFPAARVWAFEPGPENYARLSVRFAGDRRVLPVQAALSDTAGEQNLAVTDADMTHSLLPLDAASPYPDYPIRQIGEIHVKTVTVDGFCRDAGIEQINVLKLDVQGFEGPILRGAGKLLQEGRIDLVFTELNFVRVYQGQTRTEDVLSILGESGYRLFDLYNLRRAESGQVKWGDALFLSPDVRRVCGV